MMELERTTPKSVSTNVPYNLKAAIPRALQSINCSNVEKAISDRTDQISDTAKFVRRKLTVVCMEVCMEVCLLSIMRMRMFATVPITPAVTSITAKKNK